MSAALIEALDAASGIICAVGAGGKKTTLQRILAAHPGRVGITATVKSTLPAAERVDQRLIEAPERLGHCLDALAADCRRVAFAAPGHRPGRVAGLDPALVAALHERGGFALTLVKADGARMRGIKAPRADEPVIARHCKTVISVVSAAVIGAPLDARVAHRPERLAGLLDLAPGEPIQPRHLGRLLAHPKGARQHLGSARHIALINQVDDDARRHRAAEAAAEALAARRPPDRVVLASMTATEPLVDIVEPASRAAD